MKALRKHVGGPWEVIDVENDIRALQYQVDGYIEVVTLCSSAAIIVDEEGLIKGKPFNTRIAGLNIVGTVLIVGTAYDDFCDVDTRILKYL